MTLPQAVVDWAEALKEQAGVFCTSYQDKQVYLISAGEQRTGGYRIKVKAVRGKNDTIHYSIEGPAPTDFVIQIITYPYEIILTEKGKTLKFIQKEKGRDNPVIPVETHPLTN